MGYGSDFSGVQEIDANWTFLSGDKQERLAYAQAIVRRLSTPRGAMPRDRSYGYDLRAMLADAGLTTTQAAMAIRSEVLADERSRECVVDITESGALNARTWYVAISVIPYSEAGPFLSRSKFRSFRLSCSTSRMTTC